MAESVEPEPRLFTLEEASSLLPTLRAILGDLHGATGALAEAQQALGEHVGGRSRSNGHAGPDPTTEGLATATEAAQDRVRRAVQAIAELGCELKDPQRGMVDFRTMRDGRVVYLCWLVEEPRIMYWHELRAGYMGRQPL